MRGRRRLRLGRPSSGRRPGGRHIHSGGGWPPVEGTVLPRFRAIWHEYRSNEALANSRYRGQYYTVGGLVERVDEHGVDFVMDTYDMGASSARFARSAQDTLLTISPYDVVILSCRVRGLVLDFMLGFEDCIPVAWPGANAVTWSRGRHWRGYDYVGSCSYMVRAHQGD